MLQLQRSGGNFFAVMRPRLKRLNPVKYLNRQELDKDLLYLHKAFEKQSTTGIRGLALTLPD